MNNPYINWAKLDPVAVSTASPRHIQSVLEDALETIAKLQQPNSNWRDLHMAYTASGVRLSAICRRYYIYRMHFPLESDNSLRTRLIDHLTK